MKMTSSLHQFLQDTDVTVYVYKYTCVCGFGTSGAVDMFSFLLPRMLQQKKIQSRGEAGSESLQRNTNTINKTNEKGPKSKEPL